MADIVLKDRQGVPQTYAGYEKVAFNTPNSGTVIFSEGEATENVPIDLNLADGDQTLTAESGTLIKSAVIKKPATLTPENVAKDVNVAGVVGTFTGNGVENVEIIPDFSAGDQIVTAEADTFIKSAIVRKPETLVPENIAKGVDVAGVTGTLSGAQLSVEKDVNFRDYNGSIIASFTLDEIQSLDSLPDPPEHDGLTFHGYGLTLEQIKEENTYMDLQAMYSTSDGKTRVYITLPDGRTTPKLGIAVNGSVDIDWGDGSAHDTLVGTSLTSAVFTENHEYSEPGDYVITLTITGSANVIGAKNYYSVLLTQSGDTTDSRNYVYAYGVIRRIHFGENIGIGNYAFYNCCSLSEVLISPSVTSIGQNAFQYCYSLENLTIPVGVTSISGYAFSYCYSLKHVTVPHGISSFGARIFNYCYALERATFLKGTSSIGEYTFQECYGLKKVTIPDGAYIGSYAFASCRLFNEFIFPKGRTSIASYLFQSCLSLSNVVITSDITSISAYAFAGCYSLAKVIFLGETPPSISNSNVFSSLPTDCVIYVPNESYLTATNYPSPSTYTYVVGGAS